MKLLSTFLLLTSFYLHGQLPSDSLIGVYLIRDSTLSADLELTQDGRYAYNGIENGNIRYGYGDWFARSGRLFLHSDVQQTPPDIPRNEVVLGQPRKSDSLFVWLLPREGQIRYLNFTFYNGGEVIKVDSIVKSPRFSGGTRVWVEYVESDSVRINMPGYSPVVLNTRENRSFVVHIYEINVEENFILNNRLVEVRVESCKQELVWGKFQFERRMLCGPVDRDRLIGTYNVAEEWPYDFASLVLKDNQRFEYLWSWQGGRGITHGDWSIDNGLVTLHSDIQRVPEGQPWFEVESATQSDFDGYRTNMYNSATPDLLLMGGAQMYLEGEQIADVSSNYEATGQFLLPHTKHDSIVIRLTNQDESMVFSLGEENEIVLRVDAVDEMHYQIFEEQPWFIREENGEYVLYEKGDYRPFLKSKE